MKAVGAVALCGGLLAACGGGGDATTVPADEYARRGDELCRRLAVEVGELRAEQRLREIDSGSASEREKMRQTAAVLAEQHALVASFRRDFETLGRPSEHADDAERLLEKSRASEDELGRAVDALEDGDEVQATEAMQRYFGFAQQSSSIARDSELGFAICGSGA